MFFFEDFKIYSGLKLDFTPGLPPDGNRTPAELAEFRKSHFKEKTNYIMNTLFVKMYRKNKLL